MNWEKVDLKGDTLDTTFWIDLFRREPEALHSLLYDIYATSKGILGRGRRKRMVGNLDELWDMIFGGEE